MSIGFHGKPALWTGANEVSSPKGLVKFNPEGMLGLSLGFQPQEHTPSPCALKGRKIFVIDVWCGEAGCTATFGAERCFYQYLGLKPQAQSYHPFGIRPTVPSRANKLAAVYKIDSPSVAGFKDSLPDIASRLARQSLRESKRPREVVSFRRRGEVGRTKRIYANRNLRFSSSVRNG